MICSAKYKIFANYSKFIYLRSGTIWWPGEKTAEIAEKYLKKGSEVAVEGKLTSRSYEDKEGAKKYITEVVVNEILMLGNKE